MDPALFNMIVLSLEFGFQVGRLHRGRLLAVPHSCLCGVVATFEGVSV